MIKRSKNLTALTAGALVLILSSMALNGCRGGVSEQAPAPVSNVKVVLDTNVEIILDTSGSWLPDVWQRAKEWVIRKVVEWVRHAQPGHRLQVWSFSRSDEEADCVDRVAAWEMQVLQVPAYKHRLQFQEECTTYLKERLEEVTAGRYGSPVLEAIGSTSYPHDLTGDSWRLIVISDLMQTSQDLEFTSFQLSRCSDQELVGKMLWICPIAKNPPQSVQLISCRGIADDHAIDKQLHARIYGLFATFIEEWSSGKTVLLTDTL